MGLYLEEFEIGRAYTTRGRTVGEGDISLFAGLVGDFNPLHVNQEYAQQSRFGARILHGVVTAAIAGAPVGNYFAGTAIA